jgi:hypothetical protein
MEHGEMFKTGAAAMLLSATFLIGARFRRSQTFVLQRRNLLSFGGGVAAAYVFVHVMPEMHGARAAFVEAVSIPLRYEGMGIYFFSLIGFLVFYGSGNLRARSKKSGALDHEEREFRFRVGGFAAYAWMIGYLLVRNLDKPDVSTTFYPAAMTLHFLGIDNTLRDEYNAMYQRGGRWVLAGATMLGWGVGVLVEIPRWALAQLVAFVSGAIIVNSAVMELPSKKEGRVLPFIAGGLIYGLILLPLG